MGQLLDPFSNRFEWERTVNAFPFLFDLQGAEVSDAPFVGMGNSFLRMEIAGGDGLAHLPVGVAERNPLQDEAVDLFHTEQVRIARVLQQAGFDLDLPEGKYGYPDTGFGAFQGWEKNLF